MPDDPRALQLLSETLAVCRLEPDAAVPAWATQGPFSSITRTAEEISVVCPDRVVPEGVRAERGWRMLKVQSPLDFALTGVLAGLAGPLANAGISVFVVSTYDTDYLLVRAQDIPAGVAALRAAGHNVADAPDT